MAMKSPLSRYRLSLGFFILGLVASGLTTFPLRWEASILREMSENFGQSAAGLHQWIEFVNSGLDETYSRFPFFGYGTDWLGFGHFVIAAFFILPFRDPVRYAALLKIGLAACAGVIVVALVCGEARGVPLGWRLIDSSFGVIGAVPLLYCLRLTRSLQSPSG